MFAMDLATVRLLLICAVVAIAVLWFVIRRQRKGKRFNRRSGRPMDLGPLFDEQDLGIDPEEQPQQEATPTEDEARRAPTIQTKAQTEERPKLTPSLGGASDALKDKEVDDRNVISIHLRARKREGFSGKNLVAIFNRFNLVFGDMDIYHRRIQVNGRSETAFSVLNGKEPGTLKPIDLDTGSSCIIFFIQTQNCHNPLRSFEEMVDVAKRFASSLDGLLYDDLGSNLTEQTLNYYRDQIKELMLAKRIQEARRNVEH